MDENDAIEKARRVKNASIPNASFLTCFETSYPKQAGLEAVSFQNWTSWLTGWLVSYSWSCSFSPESFGRGLSRNRVRELPS